MATLDPTTVIISGGARGVDSIAEQAAKESELTVLVFPAHWHDTAGRYHRDAGFKRNQIIVNESDSVLAFWDGKSRGCADTACKAYKAGKRVVAIGPDGQPCWDALWGRMKEWGWIDGTDRRPDAFEAK